MKALLIANGNIDNDSYFKAIFEKENYHMILCIDGGLDKIRKMEIVPHLVLGDFDSISSQGIEYIRKHHIPIKKFSVEKDETDTEIGLNYLMENNYKDITMVGCIGNRMDHTLANIFLLKKLLNHGISGTIINGKNYIYLIDKKTAFLNRKGDIVSLLPLSNSVKGVTTSGLYYPLNEAELVKEKPLGISNIIIKDHAEVTIKEGELLIIISKD
ncbi:MAG: thiamine diphosphokinase [Eubacteriales bacterium]